MHHQIRLFNVLLVVGGVMVVTLFAEENVDLTHADLNKIDRKLTYNLGPTGLRGWIYTKPLLIRPGSSGQPSCRHGKMNYSGTRKQMDISQLLERTPVSCCGQKTRTMALNRQRTPWPR